MYSWLKICHLKRSCYWNSTQEPKVLIGHDMHYPQTPKYHYTTRLNCTQHTAPFTNFASNYATKSIISLIVYKPIQLPKNESIRCPTRSCASELNSQPTRPVPQRGTYPIAWGNPFVVSSKITDVARCFTQSRTFKALGKIA
jgi:hypothetical protein